MDTHTHTHTQDNYSNPCCACTPRVNKIHIHIANEEAEYKAHVRMYKYIHSPFTHKHTLIISTATSVSVMSG